MGKVEDFEIGEKVKLVLGVRVRVQFRARDENHCPNAHLKLEIPSISLYNANLL